MPPQTVADITAIRACWPEILDHQHPRAIAIGSGEIIAGALAMPLDRLSLAMRWITRNPTYLRALSLMGAHRLHLDGTDAGPVSKADQAVAAAMLDPQPPKPRRSALEAAAAARLMSDVEAIRSLWPLALDQKHPRPPLAPSLSDLDGLLEPDRAGVPMGWLVARKAYQRSLPPVPTHEEGDHSA